MSLAPVIALNPVRCSGEHRRAVAVGGCGNDVGSDVALAHDYLARHDKCKFMMCYARGP
jgi:hypothetical protein